jgi:Protein of unknown function (DUF4231)
MAEEQQPDAARDGANGKESDAPQTNRRSGKELREALTETLELSVEAQYKQQLDGRIEWHQQKSAHRRRRYFVFKTISLSAAAAVPVVVAIGDIIPDWVAAALGMVVVISEGLQQLLRDREIAQAHDDAVTALDTEDRHYTLRIEPYTEAATRFGLLKGNVEQAIARYQAAVRSTSGEQKGPT